MLARRVRAAGHLENALPRLGVLGVEHDATEAARYRFGQLGRRVGQAVRDVLDQRLDRALEDQAGDALLQVVGQAGRIAEEVDAAQNGGGLPLELLLVVGGDGAPVDLWEGMLVSRKSVTPVRHTGFAF